MGGLTIPQLERVALEVRRAIIRQLQVAGSGHAAGPLGFTEVMTALYFHVMRIDAEQPDWPERDLLVMSNGHYAPLLYAVMAARGFFPSSELGTLRRLGSRLQGHPERTVLPGLETTSGPLGSGLSQAVGMAYHLHHLEPSPHRFVYCTLGDGELNEGNIWEAAMSAAKYQLGQLIAIVDRNNIQIGGQTEDVMPLEDLRDKWESFGWHVQEVDGHNIQSIIEATSMARSITSRPSVIIAHTIPGRGVDFMEYDHTWHGKAPSAEDAERALAQLEVYG